MGCRDIPSKSLWEGDHAIGRGYYKDGLHMEYVKIITNSLLDKGKKEHHLSDYEVLTGDKSHFHWVPW